MPHGGRPLECEKLTNGLKSFLDVVQWNRPQCKKRKAGLTPRVTFRLSVNYFLESTSKFPHWLLIFYHCLSELNYSWSLFERHSKLSLVNELRRTLLFGRDVWQKGWDILALYWNKSIRKVRKIRHYGLRGECVPLQIPWHIHYD